MAQRDWFKRQIDGVEGLVQTRDRWRRGTGSNTRQMALRDWFIIHNNTTSYIELLQKNNNLYFDFMFISLFVVFVTVLKCHLIVFICYYSQFWQLLTLSMQFHSRHPIRILKAFENNIVLFSSSISALPIHTEVYTEC